MLTKNQIWAKRLICEIYLLTQSLYHHKLQFMPSIRREKCEK